ncbi:hypothetical protein KY321_05705 [Candidatus Woesearchaeota archaeon]|nr:hypothetical protein [Candidatus Woesearchaeota archaeon]
MNIYVKKTIPFLATALISGMMLNYGLNSKKQYHENSSVIECQSLESRRNKLENILIGIESDKEFGFLDNVKSKSSEIKDEIKYYNDQIKSIKNSEDYKLGLKHKSNYSIICYCATLIGALGLSASAIYVANGKK